MAWVADLGGAEHRRDRGLVSRRRQRDLSLAGDEPLMGATRGQSGVAARAGLEVRVTHLQLIVE